MSARVELTPLEVASGLVFGLVAEGSAAPLEAPLGALERAVLPALQRPPCLVSFSGGRDSSAILAVAAGVARREGLPLPVPATNRFVAAPASREDEWQERVVTHLELQDWVRLEHGDELDLVGPCARRVLLRHGPLWPFNAHFHVPLLEAASGGSLLTGIGGDELLGDSRWARQLDLLHGRVRPVPRDARRLAYFVAPRRARSAWLARRLPVPFGWLRPSARKEVGRNWARQLAGEPRRLRRHVHWRGRLRYMQVGTSSLARLAADAGVMLGHPFLDPGFRAGLAAAPLPLASRTAAMEALFGRLLPSDVLTRGTKSSFDEAFFARPSREFAASWPGDGVDLAVVDPGALAAEWSREQPDPRSFLLLQATWLASRSGGDRLQEGLGGRLERSPLVGPA